MLGCTYMHSLKTLIGTSSGMDLETESELRLYCWSSENEIQNNGKLKLNWDLGLTVT